MRAMVVTVRVSVSVLHGEVGFELAVRRSETARTAWTEAGISFPEDFFKRCRGSYGSIAEPTVYAYLWQLSSPRTRKHKIMKTCG